MPKFDEYLEEYRRKYKFRPDVLKNNERLCQTINELAEERYRIFNELHEYDTVDADIWVNEPPTFIIYGESPYPGPSHSYNLRSEDIIQIQVILRYKKECLEKRLIAVFYDKWDFTNTYREIIELIKKKPNLSYNELLNLTKEKHSDLELELLIELGILVRCGKTGQRFWRINKEETPAYEERLKGEERYITNREKVQWQRKR